MNNKLNDEVAWLSNISFTQVLELKNWYNWNQQFTVSHLRNKESFLVARLYLASEIAGSEGSKALVSKIGNNIN